MEHDGGAGSGRASSLAGQTGMYSGRVTFPSLCVRMVTHRMPRPRSSQTDVLSLTLITRGAKVLSKVLPIFSPKKCNMAGKTFGRCRSRFFAMFGMIQVNPNQRPPTLLLPQLLQFGFAGHIVQSVSGKNLHCRKEI